MTLADIARAADVPVESVLRVLNHDEVSSEVAARVRDALEAYGYGRLPQLAARTDTEAAGTSPPDADRATMVDALLHRLAQDVEELKLELRRAQTERLEDLTLVVDLLTTSWRAVDRRLGAIDRKLERLEHPRSRLP
jgi:DNA-binding LacI/PurR family transcriptional regulator